MSAVETDPAPAGQLLAMRVATKGDAVRELLRIRAFQAVIAGYDARVRGWLEGELLTAEAADDTDAACRVKGVGGAWVTSPTMRWVASDAAELVAWARAHRPAAVTEHRQANSNLLDAWLNDPAGDPAARAAALRRLVGDDRVVRDTATVSDDLPAELAAAAEILDDAVVVEPASGEQLPIRQVAVSERTFTFKPAPGAVRQLAEELCEHLDQVLAVSSPAAQA
jgi:hypothetical protein